MAQKNLMNENEQEKGMRQPQFAAQSALAVTGYKKVVFVVCWVRHKFIYCISDWSLIVYNYSGEEEIAVTVVLLTAVAVTVAVAAAAAAPFSLRPSYSLTIWSRRGGHTQKS